MQVVTLIIAILGWVTATAALTWNIVAWLLAGARASVELRVGAVLPAGQYLSLPVTPDWQARLRENLEINGLTGRLVLLVDVRNTGRTRLTVQRCGFRMPYGEQYGSIGGPDIGERFPVVLEPGDVTTLGYEAAPVLTAAATTLAIRGTSDARLRARVELGSGKLVDSKEHLPVPAA